MAESSSDDDSHEKALLLPPSSDPSSVRPSVQGKPKQDSHEEKTPTVVEVSRKSRRRRAEGLTFLLLLSVVAATLGSSTQFGFNTGVINSPKQAILDSFNGHGNDSMIDVPFTTLEMNVAVAIFAIGGLVGAVPAGMFADLIGRKYTMLLNNIVILVGVALESLAIHPAMFILGRFVVGVNSGVNTVLVPLYISEVSPVRLRGALGVMHQMAITNTILLSWVLSIKEGLSRPDEDFYAWRILFAVPLVFMLFQLVVLPWCPESPRFLYIKWRKEQTAIRALKRLRGTPDVNGEVKELEEELEEVQRVGKKDSVKRTLDTLREFCVKPSLRRPFLISIVLHLAQQLCGIGGVLYYSTQIFQDAGLKRGDLATVVVGVVLVLFTIVTVFLIENVGRRTLMLYGLGGMTIFFAFLTSMFCFQEAFYGNEDSSVTPPGILLVVSALGITALFALGPGAISWLMVPELFLQETRPVAVTIATAVNWLANFTVGLAFPYILDFLHPYGTAIFIVTCFLFWLYLYIYLPETKGKSVEEITVEFRRKTGEVETPSPR